MGDRTTVEVALSDTASVGGSTREFFIRSCCNVSTSQVLVLLYIGVYK